MKRRSFLTHTASCAAALTMGRASSARARQNSQPFSFDWLQAHARTLAQSGFESRQGSIPEPWRKLDYDEYRSIAFKRERALWRGEALFNLQLFHAGYQYDRAVDVHVVEDGLAMRLDYDASLFDFGRVDAGGLPAAGLGFAGLRVHYPLHGASYLDEMLVFLGASYFRCLGRDQQYGASARGLAVDTALGSGEEFPVFTGLWVEKPAPASTMLVLYGLLDSPSLTGAYRFAVLPSAATTLDVTAHLYTRKSIEKLGVAPLSSMFFFGENSTRRFDDYRPEVHDSDGLMIHSGAGEWLWRPLDNRRELSIGAYETTGTPRGFGLIQRDQRFSSYEDLEADYHRRPSLWVEPIGDWGDGRVELVEIPTDTEANDNVAAYWVPGEPVQAAQARQFRYRLTAYRTRPGFPPGGRTVSVRVGPPADSQSEARAGSRRFVVDFSGGELPLLAADQPVEAVFTSTNAELSPPVAVKNEHNGGWRAFFDVYPEGGQPTDLRGYLRLHGHALTETWSYLWTG